MASSRSAFKDVILAIAIVGGVLGGLFLYTGVWPPMVVVESGSMMHANACPPPEGRPELCDDVGYGKFGTIDPGDMVFVKDVGKVADVTPLAQGQAKDPNAETYGKPGDVVVYFPNNQRSRTPIIHRAIAYVEVSGIDDADLCAARGNNDPGATYAVFWDGRVHNFGASGIYLPSMGFGPGNYAEERGYKPCWSGFITKGDNPITNTLPDQALGGGVLPSQPVRLEWIEGKAVGELPWFGLIKLALSSTTNYDCATNDGRPAWRQYEPACDNGKAVRVLNAWAPADLWVMLGISLLLIGVAPLGYDMWLIRRQKGNAEAVARGEKPPPGLGDQLAAWFRSLRPKPEGPPEGADPSRAFERPPEPPPAAPPSPPPPAPSNGPARFERVKK